MCTGSDFELVVWFFLAALWVFLPLVLISHVIRIKLFVYCVVFSADFCVDGADSTWRGWQTAAGASSPAAWRRLWPRKRSTSFRWRSASKNCWKSRLYRLYSLRNYDYSTGGIFRIIVNGKHNYYLLFCVFLGQKNKKWEKIFSWVEFKYVIRTYSLSTRCGSGFLGQGSGARARGPWKLQTRRESELGKVK